MNIRMAIIVLITLLALQVAVIAVSSMTDYFGERSVSPPTLLQEGAYVQMIAGATLYPERKEWVDRSFVLSNQDSWTLILAYSETCAVSRSIASYWRSWLEDIENDSLRVLIVTHNEAVVPPIPTTGVHQWPVPIVSIHGADRNSLEYSLAALTPWYYLFDSEGTLVREDHGSLLEPLKAFVDENRGVQQ